MLSSTLKTLEDVDFVGRTQFNEIPPMLSILFPRKKNLYSDIS